VDATYNRWLNDLDADVVLVRPDFHLYGAGRADQADELAGGFLAALRSPAPVTAR
jgi:3-(3-hydroxy-phenyl)propionate hydroxylase